ncbi:MAG: HD domain-containing protein [Clostridia bacterium]|nr:HD domain-containing protein [Clostridia bacterium]
MSKEKNVIEFYVLCNKLKNVIRTGWNDWNVKRERIESVAEHIYSVQMLALAMHSEFNYDIDLKKTITMIAVHELEEILIGDLTCFQITKEEKAKMGHEAVEKVLKNLANKDEIKNLILEFDERKTNESIFAYYCDKLECDLQCKIYDEENCVDVTNQPNNNAMKDKDVINLLSSGKSWSEMWLTFGQERYNYDENFKSVSDYAINNKITNK